jgi:hypothetical protein
MVGLHYLWILPKVAETVIVNYCDFCPEQEAKSRAVAKCELCGQLVCYNHLIEVGFQALHRPESSERKVERKTSWRMRRLLGRPYENRHVVCVACAQGSLWTVVGKLKQEMLLGLKSSE